METNLFLKCRKTKNRREEILNSKWSNMNVAMAFRKLLIGKKVMDLRTLGTLHISSDVKGKTS
jgi:hypothetical protein